MSYGILLNNFNSYRVKVMSDAEVSDYQILLLSRRMFLVELGVRI